MTSGLLISQVSCYGSERILQPQFDFASTVYRDGRIVVVYIYQRIGRREQVRVIECVKEIHSELERLISQLPEVNGEVTGYRGVKIDLSWPEH